MNTTLSYYKTHAQEFIKNTLDKEMNLQYALFEKHLLSISHILDAGCGSGRDSLYFKSQGHTVSAFDASKEMCDFASKLLCQDVAQLRFDELNFENRFDAIWASASLLHVPKVQMPEILVLLSKALKDKGILYASFKHDDREFIKEGRLFNSYTLESFSNLIEASSFRIKESLVLKDTRPDKEGEFWLNLVLAVNKS